MEKCARFGIVANRVQCERRVAGARLRRDLRALFLTFDEGVLHHVTNNVTENRTRVLYSYDNFVSVNGPLVKVANGSIHFEDPTARSVLTAAVIGSFDGLSRLRSDGSREGNKVDSLVGMTELKLGFDASYSKVRPMLDRYDLNKDGFLDVDTYSLDLFGRRTACDNGTRWVSFEGFFPECVPYAYKKSKTRLMESIRASVVTAFGKVLPNTTDLLTVVSDLMKEQVMAAESMQYVAPPPKIFIGPDAFPPVAAFRGGPVLRQYKPNGTCANTPADAGMCGSVPDFVPATKRGPYVREYNVRLDISNNGQEYASGKLLKPQRFYYYEKGEVQSFKPRLGPDYGGTVASIQGKGFLEGAGLLCVYDDLDWGDKDYKMPAKFRYPWELECASPAHEATPPLGDYVQLETTNNDQQYTSNQIYFDYYPAPNITGAKPNVAPRRGGTLVTLGGLKFLSKTHHYPTILLCKFGEIVSKAVFLDSETLQCNTPKAPSGTIFLEITMNGQQYTEDLTEFTFFGIDSVYPAIGPLAGNTMVSVNGKGFMNVSSIRCRFGFTQTDGVYISYFEILCPSPPVVDASTVPLEITFYQNEWTQSGMNFTYFEPSYVFAVTPSIEGQGLGPDRGGSYLLIDGANFVNHETRLNRCRFRSLDKKRQTEVDAQWISKEKVFCYSPAWNLLKRGAGKNGTLGLFQDEVVSLAVTFNGQQYTDTMTGTSLSYLFYPSLEIMELAPANAPSSGGPAFGYFVQSRYYDGVKMFTTVTVYGENFKSSEKTYCKWGNNTYYSISNTKVFR